MKFDIVVYTEDEEDEWDHFILKSINGTVYHSRNFLNYHPDDRFIDNSIMIYRNTELIAVVPSCHNKTNTYFSHRGSTYGGPVFSKSIFRIRYLSILI